MLEKIKKAIFAKYKKTDNKWLFISIFDNKNTLIASNGVIFSDKELEPLIDTLYKWLMAKHEKNIANIIIDVVTKHQEVADIKEIQSINLKEYWLILNTGNKSWVLLPDTAWIWDIATALKVIKAKNWLEWNANITKFKTDRFSV